jgi:hypothetical protein
MSNINNWSRIAATIVSRYEAAYGPIAPRSVVSIRRLQKITEDEHGISIDFERGPAEEFVKQRILGLLARSHTKNASGREIHKIIVADYPIETLSNCYVRYIQAKEICHIWLDDADTYVQSPATLLDELALQFYVADFEPKQNARALHSERVTKYMAANVLFQTKHRAAEKARLTTKQIKTFDIADAYKVPEALVDILLDGQYMDFMKDHE